MRVRHLTNMGEIPIKSGRFRQTCVWMPKKRVSSPKTAFLGACTIGSHLLGKLLVTVLDHVFLASKGMQADSGGSRGYRGMQGDAGGA